MKRQLPNKQTGSALVVSLTILLVLTILGVSAMRTTSLEDKMAGNARDAQTAFEAAEFALRQAETALAANTVVESDFNNAGAYHKERGVNAEAWTSEANWGAAFNAVTYPDYIAQDVAKAPQFMIQVVESNLLIEDSPELGNYRHPPAKINVYQISARGFGVSPNSRVMLQSFYME